MGFQANSPIAPSCGISPSAVLNSPINLLHLSQLHTNLLIHNHLYEFSLNLE